MGTLKYGSRGEDVIALQMALNKSGYDLATDGIFGKKTQAAVRSYQKAQGLSVDGIVGKNTWGALNSAPAAPSGSETTTAAGDSALTKQLESLIAQFNATPAYTPKTDAEIRTQAEGEYKSYYDQLRLAAQQAQERSDLALAQQRDALNKTYDKQREASEKQYADAYSAADRQMLSRGMQRSSYAAQTLANIDTQGAQAQQAIADAQAAAQGDIDEQRAQLAGQLAAQLSQYDAGYAADVLKRIQEIEDQEYERGQNSANTQNSLSMQIYELLYQQERDKVADRQWQQEFEESVRQFNVNASKKSSGGGGSRKSAAAAQQTPVQTAAPATANPYGTLSSLTSSISQFLGSALGGGTKTPAKPNSNGSDVDVISGPAVSVKKALR